MQLHPLLNLLHLSQTKKTFPIDSTALRLRNFFHYITKKQLKHLSNIFLLLIIRQKVDQSSLYKTKHILLTHAFFHII